MQQHSNAEVKAYNEAIIEKARLDEEEAQRKRQASALKDEAIPGAAAGERGKLLTEAIGGKYLELTQRLVRTMHQQIDPQEKAMRDEIEALKTSMLWGDRRRRHTHAARQENGRAPGRA